MRPAWILLFVAACTGDQKTDDTSEPTGATGDTGGSILVVEDGSGEACLASIDSVDLYQVGYGYADDTLVADAAPYVLVMFDNCVSGDAFEVQTACEVTLDGSTLSVTATANYRLPAGSAVSDCNWVLTWCEAPVLAAGNYALEYAGNSVSIDIPSTGPLPCTAFPF